MANTFLDFIDKNEESIPVVNVENENDIAIIGVSVKLPLADTTDEFWEKLKSGRDCVRKMKGSRLKDIYDYHEFMKDTNIQLEEAAYLERIDCFAYDFFGISPKEAQLMDPCQRLYLEAVWNVLEDGGYTKSQVQGQNIGVYLGHTGETEYRTMVEHIEPENMDIATVGNLVPVIAGRISHLLDLKGPNVVINTLCSSSLVAVHYACEAILKGECKMAIASGIQLHINPIRKAKMGIESSDYRSKTFDNSADGTGCGEGIGCVLLKPLQKALLDHDNIYAVIKGSGVNHDGHAIGISAPNPEAQASLLEHVWRKSNINPEDIGYIEAHGTGTMLGDIVEIDGLTKAFRKYTNRKQFCAVGTVKSNIGHLDGASGIIGLIKTALMLKNKKIPPTIHFYRPNKKIAFTSSPVFVNDYLQEWKSNQNGTRIGGVSSFGLSGTNCHVVLEEAPEQKMERVEKKEYILPISAKDKIDLAAFLDKYIEYLSKNKEICLGDICYTSSFGKEHYAYRVAVVGSSHNEMIEKIQEKKAQLDRGYGISSLHENVELFQVYEDLTKENVDRKSLLECIGSFYENGEDIKWNLVQGTQYKKLSLPTYPFKRNRCWLTIPENNTLAVSTYTMEWEKQSTDITDEWKRRNTSLIFQSRSEKAERLINYVSDISNKTVVVELDEKFEKVSENKYLSAMKEPDFQYLLEEVDIEEIDLIVYCVCQEHEAMRTENEEQMLEGLFYLHKHLLAKIQKDVKLRIVTEYSDCITKDDMKISPEQRCIIGLGKAIACEKMNLDVKCLDIDSEFNKSDILQFINEETEFYSAIRDGNRYINVFMEKNDSSTNESITVRNNGVYIITGGLGGFGLDIAEYLSSCQSVNLILLGRRSITSHEEERKDVIEKIRKIRKTGSTVEYFQVDVTDAFKMKQAVNEIYAKYHKVNGVFHCAGIGAGMKGTSLGDETYENFSAVVKPKKNGTYVLYDAIKEYPVDFMVLMTSPITITGGVNSGSYIVANSFLDAFGKRKENKMFIGSISWSPRMETVLDSNATFHFDRQLFLPLSKKEIFSCLEQFFEKPSPYSIVGNINPKNEILDVRESLMFAVANNLREQTVKKEKQSIIVENQMVKLTGREENSYSNLEQIVANGYGNVFGYNEIGVTDSFYEIGGDSIIAMKLVNWLNEKEKLGLKLSEFISYPSIEMLANYLDVKQKDEDSEKEIKHVERQKYYKATEAQKEIYVSCKANGDTVSYNMPAVFSLTGPFDVCKFKKAIECLCNRHELLRASFFVNDDGEINYSVNEPEIDVQYREIEEFKLAEYMETFVKVFNLEKSPLWKVEVLKIDASNYMILFDMHHIIADDRAMEIFLTDLFSFYQGKELKELTYEHCDYAKWYEDNLAANHMKQQKDYWISALGEKRNSLKLAPKSLGEGDRSLEGAVVEIVLSDEFSKVLRMYSKQKGMSVFSIMISAFSILLSRYSKQEDIIIGVPISLREKVEFDDIFGPLLNTVALRTAPYNYLCIKEFLENVKKDVKALYSNKDYPINSLIYELGGQRESSRNPFYNVLFDYHGKSKEILNVSEGLTLTSIPFSEDISKLDMTMNVSEVEENFKVWIEYSTDLFHEEFVVELLENYKKVLDCFVTDEKVMLGNIILSQKCFTNEDSEIFEELNEEVTFNF